MLCLGVFGLLFFSLYVIGDSISSVFVVKVISMLVIKVVVFMIWKMLLI